MIHFNTKPDLSKITVRSTDNPLSLLSSTSNFPSLTTHTSVAVNNPEYFKATVDAATGNFVSNMIGSVATGVNNLIGNNVQNPIENTDEEKQEEKIDVDNVDQIISERVEEEHSPEEKKKEMKKNYDNIAVETTENEQREQDAMANANTIRELRERKDVERQNEEHEAPKSMFAESLKQYLEEKHEEIKERSAESKNTFLKYFENSDRWAKFLEDVASDKEASHYYDTYPGKHEEHLSKVFENMRDQARYLHMNYKPKDYLNLLKPTSMNGKAMVQNLSSLINTE